MEYVALDFETANGRIDSVCQIGAVTFRDGKVISRYERLIRPQPFYFDALNIQIHGIDAETVKQAPTFAENYPEFLQYINHKKIICHNAGFDMAVLYQVLQRYDLPLPSIQYECTLALSRAFIKNEASYSLAKLTASVLDFRFKHHDALEDAYACGMLYQYLLHHYDIASYVEQEYIIGTYDKNEHITFRKKHYKPRSSITKPVVEKVDDLLANQCFCFTGRLSKARNHFAEIVLSHGGDVTDFVDQSTNFLVIGTMNKRNGVPVISSKLKKAESLQQQGANLVVLTESEFFELLEQYITT